MFWRARFASRASRQLVPQRAEESQTINSRLQQISDEDFLRKLKLTHTPPIAVCLWIILKVVSKHDSRSLESGDKWKLPEKRRLRFTHSKSYIKRMSEATHDRSVLSDEVAEWSDAQRPVRVGF